MTIIVKGLSTPADLYCLRNAKDDFRAKEEYQMYWRYNLAYFLLASVVALVLALLIVCVDAQARIAFESGREGSTEIYLMDTDGSNQQNLTNNPASDHSPSWSPDGKRIVFVSDRAGHAKDGIHGRPTSEIYVMDADGGNQQNLTNHRADDEYPSWSPDGKRIVFSSDRDQGRDDPHNYEIYVMDADGGNEQRLTENRNNDWQPVWSPDGERIAFSSDTKGDIRIFDIYVMNADGGNLQNLTNHHTWNGSPSWSPNSQRIVFHSFREGNTDIYVMDTDGSNLQNLTNNRHRNSGPAWFNSPLSVSLEDKILTIWGWVKQGDR